MWIDIDTQRLSLNYLLHKIMKAKPLLTGGILAALLGFVLGYVWYMLLFKAQYENDVSKLVMKPEAEGNMAMIILSMLVAGFAMAAVYGKWSGGKHSLTDGLTLGVLVGLIPGLAYALMSYGTSNMLTSTGLVLEALYGVVNYGLMGAVIALVYSKMDKPEAS